MEKKVAKKKPEEGILKDTAVAIGEAAGKVTAIAKSVFTHKKAASGAPVKKARAGKLPPKNKARLPRKQKKALAKQTAKQTAKA